MLVPLIVVLAIADDVHIMQHWDEERRHGDVEHAFKATVAHLTAPLLGASATTALGMLSLATSSVVAVRAFGIGSAVGDHGRFRHLDRPDADAAVAREAGDGGSAARALLPRAAQGGRAVLVRARPGACWRYRRWSWPSSRRSASCACGSTPTTSASSAPTIRSGSRPRSSTRSSAASTASRSCSRGRPSRCKTPDALQRIDRLEEALRQFPHVRKVTSVADYVKRINKELNDGRPEANVVPADADTIAQELFVFALGGEGRHELERSRGERLLAGADFDQAAVDELGPRARAGRGGRSDGEGDLRRHRDHRARRPAPAVCSARSITIW